tara:strand:- start:1813 stop:1968 length:156 start_codon:yes stop_codon:yes gene_type:complete
MDKTMWITDLLEDLKDFYIWKQFINDPDFVTKWVEDRDGLLKTITRPTLYK